MAYDNELVTVSGTSVPDNVGPSGGLLLCIKPYATWAHIGFDNGTFIIEQGYADHPIGAVSWYGAATYCNWLGMIEGISPTYNQESGLCVSAIHMMLKAIGFRPMPSGNTQLATMMEGFIHGEMSLLIATDATSIFAQMMPWQLGISS